MPALLVVGSAPCFQEDLDAARAIYPDAHLILINGACVAVEAAEHVLAGHTNKAEQFAAARRNAFPDAPPWRLHANWLRYPAVPSKEYPSVTDWWGPEMSTGATSAGKAARIGMKLGYAPIVLCGAPLDGSGYFAGESVTGGKITHDCHRVGNAETHQYRSVKRYRDTFKKLAETEWQGKVFSMSGFTRDCLGGPLDFLT